jgi:hypothetical protein
LRLAYSYDDRTMSKSDWMSCGSLMIRVASLPKSGFGAGEALGKRGRERGLEHGRASAKLIRLAAKAVKDQHHTKEANGRLAAESYGTV